MAGTHQDFVEAWEDMEEDLSKAKGNLALALHKPMGKPLAAALLLGKHTRRFSPVTHGINA